jgi:hypothetical protein
MFPPSVRVLDWHEVTDFPQFAAEKRKIALRQVMVPA